MLSTRAVDRRVKNAVNYDNKDLKLSQEHLNALATDGKILNRSRWLNAVSFESVESPEILKEKYDFIDRITPVKEGQHKVNKDQFEYHEAKSLNYGVADTQTRQIGADCLHDMGFTGQGVYLALIDAGFRGMDTIPYFDSIYLESRVLDSFDFVNNLTVYDYSGHGTAVGSCIFAEMSGANAYSGTAVDVDIALYVSEDVSSETLIEEFNLVAALERCDSVGVDIASISLGYTVFDNPADDHNYWDMDGETTIASQGINTAVSKGILVVAAAGNQGPSFISTPCDADSVLCIGAVDNQGNYAGFSSVGPASDGQVKPDVMATGNDTWVVIEDGNLVMGDGTSFATPVMAGAIACLIQANPNNTVAQINQAIRQSASQFLSPDGYMGYGIPSMCVANDSLIALGVGLKDMSQADFSFYPNPADNWLNIVLANKNENASIGIHSVSGHTVYSGGTNEKMINTSTLQEGLYLIHLTDAQATRTYKLLIKH